MTDAAKIDTTIHLGSIAVHQPVTVFTDYIIFAMCFFYYLKLKSISNPNKSTRNWTFFFLLLSFASLAGGCSHAFFEVHEGVAYKSFWLTMQLLNGWSVYVAQVATLDSALSDSPNKNKWLVSHKILLTVFVVAVFVFQNFLVVVIDSAWGLIPIMIIHFTDAKKVKDSNWIAYGIAVLFISAIVNATKLSISIYFNYLDIAHVFIIVNLTFMFIGIKRKAISLAQFSTLFRFR